MPKRLSPSDTMFLYGESREQMMHVAGMMPFTPAPDSSPDQMRELMNALRAGAPVYSPWNLKLRTPDLLWNPLQSWVEEPDVDLEYHVRRSALPSPGDERELGILVSRLHGHHVDFHRPPWEMHLIEGLERGRFAWYVKIHHALVDGYTAMQVLINSLSSDPDEHDRPLFFSLPPRARAPRGAESSKPEATSEATTEAKTDARPEAKPESSEPAESSGGIHCPELLAAIRAQYGASKSVVRALMNVVQSSRTGDHDLVSPLEAPRCVLNARISKSRRFATQSLSFERIRAIARAAGGTLNDIVLALSGASLRTYLIEQSALPAAPLVAMLPVAIRAKDELGGGNAVGAILATLATDIDDPAERLGRIIASTTRAKRQLQGMSRAAILQYSALLTAPSMLQMIPSTAGHVRPTFNVVISNVPGPDRPLYFRGARLESSYPMSIPVHGQALNITCTSYAGMVCFGFTGCRDTVPHLQRLAVYCGEALPELEQAVLHG
ncbi:MAG TPA: wax ester/triacylglycerol synthase family O-acyltransferase [Kofleriaceae bacterium]|nr:wax ester/triacylglycerol synthase family O-acyltransferase [Kofleriaceae bacterium]